MWLSDVFVVGVAFAFDFSKFSMRVPLPPSSSFRRATRYSEVPAPALGMRSSPHIQYDSDALLARRVA